MKKQGGKHIGRLRAGINIVRKDPSLGKTALVQPFSVLIGKRHDENAGICVFLLRGGNFLNMRGNSVPVLIQADV